LKSYEILHKYFIYNLLPIYCLTVWVNLDLKVLNIRILLNRSNATTQILKKELIGQDCYVIGKISHNFLFPKMAAINHHGESGTTVTVARAGILFLQRL